MPAFLAAVETPEQDPLNVHGDLGPGPDSTPAIGAQTVRHWQAEYGIFEIRWPARPNLDPTNELDPVFTEGPSSFTTSFHRPEPNRFAFLIDTGVGNGPCRYFSAEMYGDNERAIEEQSGFFVSLLHPRSELQDYFDEVLPTITTSTGGADRKPGECVRAPDADDVDVTEAAATAFVQRFLEDRYNDDRAQACLTEAAFGQFDNDATGEYPLCLFPRNACGSGMVFSEPQLFGRGAGQLVSVVVKHVSGPTVRETYDVISVNDGNPRLAIGRVIAEPESYVTRERAVTRVTEFLDLVAAGKLEDVGPYLINEGISPQVTAALGSDDLAVYDELPELLAIYCQTAFCDSPFRVLDGGEVQLFGREVIVRFGNEVNQTFPVGAFENVLTVNNLPPRLP